MIVIYEVASDLAVSRLFNFANYLGQNSQVLQRTLAFSEACHGIGKQTVGHAGATYGIHIEAGAFEYYVRSSFVHLGFCSAHNAPETYRLLVGGYHYGLGPWSYLFTIK